MTSKNIQDSRELHQFFAPKIDVVKALVMVQKGVTVASLKAQYGDIPAAWIYNLITD